MTILHASAAPNHSRLRDQNKLFASRRLLLLHFITWSPIPVMTGVFQYEARRATGSRANAQAGPMKAITSSRKCMSAASPGDFAPEHFG